MFKKKNRKEKDKKDKKITIMSFWLGFLSVLVVFLSFELFDENKYNTLENFLAEEYYSLEHVVDAIKNKLGNECDEYESPQVFFYQNFDNYIYTLVLEDINRYEPAELANYNVYMNSRRANEVLTVLNDKQEVQVEMYGNVCYIKIPGFDKGVTYEGLLEHEDEIAGCKDFIIDLRDNTGGDVDELIDVLSLFYEHGSVVFSYIVDDEITKVTATKKQVTEFENIVFLCNETTASSAEMMIFNMKSDFGDKVKVVGNETHGKYFSYSYKQFKDDELFLFVTALMGNSKGESFGEEGLVPDYQVEDVKCMEKALEILNNSVSE